MTRLLLIFSAFLCLGNTTMAQGSNAQRFEFGISGGLTYYLGDMNNVHFRDSKLSGGLVFKNNLNKRISLRGNFIYGRIESDDATALNLTQINRNLNFKSTLLELSGMVEINFFNYLAGEFRKYKPYTPFIAIGLGYLHHNPKGRFNNDFVELQPLGTEGQGTSFNNNKQYKLNQIIIPISFGFKWSLSNHFALSAEYGIRKTFTDYLDDISGNYADPFVLASENGTLSAELADQSLNQEGESASNTSVKRGDPNTKDWYTYSNVTLTYLFGKEPGCKGNFRKKRFN